MNDREGNTIFGGIAFGTYVNSYHFDMAIEYLIQGDVIQAKGEGFSEVKWVGFNLAPNEMVFFPKMSIGNTANIYLEPNHRVLLHGCWVMNRLGISEILVPAKYLIGWKGIEQRCGIVSHIFHILLERHSILDIEGACVETLAPRDYINAQDSAQASGSPILRNISSMSLEYAHPIASRFDIEKLFN